MINKAIDSRKRIRSIHIPILNSSLLYDLASFIKPEGTYIKTSVEAEPLDEILSQLCIYEVNF